jgi:putative ABC transport system substrate-binding protein
MTAWPFAARAQQRAVLRRVGVLMSIAADDEAGQRRLSAFVQAMQQLGWTVGSNLQLDIRWHTGNPAGVRKNAAELVSFAPDAILGSGGAVVGALRDATRTIPIVFTLTPDPVAAGFVDSLAHPGGNATGFTSQEYGLGTKWLELLKEIAPGTTRAAVLRDASIPQGVALFAVIQTLGPSFGIELRSIDIRDPGEIERGITGYASASNSGLIVSASGLAMVHRHMIIELAARHRLPAVYFQRSFTRDGGLISYGTDDVDPHRRAAGYVDRILKGEKPADLPVQAPTKYELVINLKTAKALGLTVPPTLLARADEVIE